MFFADQRKVWKAGGVAGLSRSELVALFARRPVPAGTPVLLEELGATVWTESGLGAPADLDQLQRRITELEQQLTDAQGQLEE